MDEEIKNNIYNSDKNKETFIMRCDNSEWENKCEKMKSIVIDINNERIYKSRIVYTQYDDTSCIHHNSGCEISFDNSLYGKLMYMKDGFFNQKK